MRLFHKVFIYVFVVLLSFSSLVYADEVFYTVCSFDGLQEQFSTYEEALEFFNEHKDEYDNLLIKQDNRVIKMEYGIVAFYVDEACSITFEYHSDDKNESDYLNGCYGIDAAYLDSDSKNVYFMISSDRGHTSLNNVTLIPLQELNVKPSSYHVKDGVLYHDIKTQLTDEYFTYSIKLSDSPKEMKDSETYYSYDGHFFYNEYEKMIDDYCNDNHENAINEEPYYNYYQYLPYRSLSNYNYDEVEKYIYETLGINGKLDSYHDLSNDSSNDDVNRSQLYGEINNFFSYQYMYGTNGLMLLASSIVDSNYGKSANAYYRNSLYNNMAFDNNEEKDNRHYNSVEKSIYSYAKYLISNVYGDYHRKTYHGTYFGNKVGGINVEYSLDPYYGEKCASTYYDLDKNMSYSDNNKYALAIIEDNISFYKDADLSKFYFKTKSIKELSLIILEEYEDSYKVQIDYTGSRDYQYDFEDSVAYIDEDDVKYIINEDKIHENEYVDVSYDFDDGNYAGQDEIEIKVIDGSLLNIKPHKDGYRFVGFDENNVAQYKKLDRIEIINQFPNEIKLGQYLDLSSSQLKIIYEDGTSDIEDLNSDYVSYYDNKTEDIQNIEISYEGTCIEQDINVVEDVDLDKFKEAIKTNDYESASYIKDNLNDTSHVLSFMDIISIDKTLYDNNSYNYHIYDNNREIAVSGMALSLDYPTFGSLIYTDTYYLRVKDASKNTVNTISKYADAYGFDIVDAYNIDFSMNYDDLKLNGPVIIQSKIDNSDRNTYSVYHLNHDGDIVKCKTLFSENSVSFICQEEGDYVILSLDSINDFISFNGNMNVSKDNNDPDNHHIIRQVFYFAILMLLGFINIFIYYIFANKRKNVWIDYRKSLRIVDTVQEGKRKN